MKYGVLMLAGLIALPLTSAHGQTVSNETVSRPSAAEIEKRWGAFALLPGSDWQSFSVSPHPFAVTSYTWLRHGQILEERWKPVKGKSSTAIYFIRPDGSLVRKTDRALDDDMKVNADGSVQWIDKRFGVAIPKRYVVESPDQIAVHRALSGGRSDVILLKRVKEASGSAILERGQRARSHPATGLGEGTEVAFGVFDHEKSTTNPISAQVFRVEGNYLHIGTPYGAAFYPRGADGAYHDPDGSDLYRIVDMYTVDRFSKQPGNPFISRYTRRGDVSPDYFEVAHRNGEAVLRWYVQRLAEEDRERASREAEQRAAEPETTTNASSGILGGFAKGLAEATASNNAMEQSMRDAANRGIATGVAEYARRQTGASSAGGGSAGNISQNRPAPTPRTVTSQAPDISTTAATKVGSDDAMGTLRFMLMVPLVEPINGSNAFCYSNIVTTTSPGWEGKSWGRMQKARAVVEPYEASFLDKCRGRAKLQSENVQISWNDASNSAGEPERTSARFRSKGFPQVNIP